MSHAGILNIGNEETANHTHAESDNDFDELESNADSTVTVPPTASPLNDMLMFQLIHDVDPLSESCDGYGIDLYLKTMRFIVTNNP